MMIKTVTRLRLNQLIIAVLMLFSLGMAMAPVASAVNDNPGGGSGNENVSSGPTKCDHGGSVSAKSFCYKCPDGSTGVTAENCPGVKAGTVCGGDESATVVSINLGCKGKGNSILDIMFAIIKFLTTGVGIVMVGSLIYAGIMYTTSRGDPSATAQAINRIRANVVALVLFAFAYALVNYLVPGQFLR